MPEPRYTVAARMVEQRYVLLDHESEGTQPLEIGEESYVDTTSADGTGERVLFHTGVSEAYAGQGLASVLVRAAVDDTLASGRKVVPVCPYVKAWLQNHPEYTEHVTAVREDHLEAVRARG